MKRLLLASALAVALLGLRPGESKAFWNSPQCAQGYPWLQGKALNFLAKNHFNGPLYNYGPYLGGNGYAWNFVAHPFCGAYIPAFPASYWGGYPVGPWSDFNYLPYPRGPAGVLPGNWPVPPAVPGAVPTRDLGPIVTPMPTGDLEPPVAPALPLPKPTTSNYYGTQSPPYFRNR
jgi:hypothetical protein